MVALFRGRPLTLDIRLLFEKVRSQVKAPVGLEDIEEFEVIYRIPRAAITEEILEGVRQLHEPDEIEPFLRDILADKTETPHTSTEIADILTTHVTHLRQSRQTAFVNKGKSYPKVTAKEVSYQLLRLRQIPNLGLMVLLAVGDIYDDAKRDFLQISEDAGVDYMIVDKIDVARLFIAYHKICPKDGTPFFNGKCRKCGTPANEPIELTLKVHEELRYDILSHDDISYGQLKRYRANIWTDPHYSKAALLEVIKRVTWELRQSQFYSSKEIESHFCEQEADCVFLRVYLDWRDEQQTNWVCRSCWVRPDLPEASRHWSIGANERLGEIEIDWNHDYYHQRDFWSQHLGKKEDWVRKVEGLLPKVEEIVREARRLLEEYGKDKFKEQKLQARFEQLEAQSWKLFQEAGNKKVPPLYCQECDSVFLAVISSFQDIFIPFATPKESGLNWEQKLRIMQNHLKMYEESKARFHYEWRKIGRR